MELAGLVPGSGQMKKCWDVIEMKRTVYKEQQADAMLAELRRSAMPE